MSSSNYSGVLTNKNTNGLPFIQPSSGLYVRLINTDTQETVASSNPTDGNGYYETPRPSTGTYGVWVCQTIDGTFVFTGEQIDVFNTADATGGGGGGGFDPSAVHLAGSETITGLKQVAADFYFYSGRPYIDPCASVYGGGADPTGTRDSTASLHEARDDAGTSKPIWLDYGTYLVGSPTMFTLNKNKQVWRGAGPGLTTLKANGPIAKVVDLATASGFNGYFLVRDLTIDGVSPSNATYGLYFEDTASSGTIWNVEVKNCGTGVANADHAQSTYFWHLNASYNNIGVNWAKHGQQTTWEGGRICANAVNQLLIGDDTQFVSGPLKFSGVNLQSSGPTSAQTNVIIKSAGPVAFDECYWESQLYAASNDVVIASSAMGTVLVFIKNSFFNGNGVAANSLVVNSGVTQNTQIQNTKFTSYTTPVLDNGGNNSRVIRLGSLEGSTFQPFSMEYAGIVRFSSSASALALGSSSTGGRPSASGAGAGAMWFDTTLNKPIWSTGTAWVDATGATV